MYAYTFCKLPDTSHFFDEEKFKEGDPNQKELYIQAKQPNMDLILTYEEIEAKKCNYARFVPKGCCFIDFDNPDEAEKMLEIILHSGLKCLILKTQHGYHFLFKIPEFYKVQMTNVTNWFGYKFDTKGVIDKENAVQIIRVCGMERDERYSLDMSEPVDPASIDTETLDVLPYWLWGKKEDKDLHKEGNPGESSYTLTDTPFTKLMTMKDGGRHDQIFSRCRMFALTNGFEKEEFKSLIRAIHNQYLIKIGTPMPESDLFGDLDTCWNKDEETMKSNGWDYDDKARKWQKETSKKGNKISEQEACELLYNKYDFFTVGSHYDTGEGGQLCYITPDLRMSFDLNIMWKELRESLRVKSFKTIFCEEVKKQLIQRCNEDKKYFRRSNTYYVCKNGMASCISDNIYDFSHLREERLTPTDLTYDWSLHDRDWVEEHKEDLGGIITKFIKKLSRDSTGIFQPEVERWLYVIVGAAMVPGNSLGKIVVLSGGGQNGKSLYLAIIKMLLGQNFYNESNIFSSSPTTKFWGEGLDKGVCCIIDELPQNYNKEAFSYIKGGVTRTASVEINPKYGKKVLIETLPQILCATNHKFDLSDDSIGMRRRMIILPCCYKVSDKEKDKLLLYRLVMNLEKNSESDEQIREYRKNEVSPTAGIIIEESGIHIREQCVLDSLDHGTLCWFANKCRYMYIDYTLELIALSQSEEMEELFDQAFGDDRKGQCKKFINEYLYSKCGTDSTRDSSLANCYIYELYSEYQKDCKNTGIEPMPEKSFDTICGKAIRELGYTTKRRKKGTFALFNEKPVVPSKKK